MYHLVILPTEHMEHTRMGCCTHIPISGPIQGHVRASRPGLVSPFNEALYKMNHQTWGLLPSPIIIPLHIICTLYVQSNGGHIPYLVLAPKMVYGPQAVSITLYKVHPQTWGHMPCPVTNMVYEPWGHVPFPIILPNMVYEP